KGKVEPRRSRTPSRIERSRNVELLGSSVRVPCSSNGHDRFQGQERTKQRMESHRLPPSVSRPQRCARDLSVSLFLFLPSWPASPAASAALVRYDLDSLVKKSDLIVRGRVVAQESYRGTFPGFGEVILTEVTIEVAGVWKGI